jgi:hypothetical protein
MMAMDCDICGDRKWVYVDPQLPSTDALDDDQRDWVGLCPCQERDESSPSALRDAAEAARADGKRIGWALALLWDPTERILVAQPWPFQLADPSDPAADVVNDIYVENEPDLAGAAQMWLAESEYWPQFEVSRMCWTCFQIVHEGHPEEQFIDGEWGHVAPTKET